MNTSPRLEGHRLVGEGFGRRFAIEIPETLVPGVVDRLVRCTWRSDGDDAEVERLWRLRYRPGAGWQGIRDGMPLARGERLEDAAERLLGDVELWLARNAEKLVFVHAGVVAWKGNVILFPGRRLVGRTRLVVSLVRAGATYFSDLFAVLDPAGLVHAYPRPLPLNPPTPSSRPRAAGGRDAHHSPLPIGLIARLTYHPAAGWRTETLTRGQAAVALISASVTNGTRAGEVSSVARSAVRRATAINGTRGETRDATYRLLGSGLYEPDTPEDHPGGPQVVDLRSPPTPQPAAPGRPPGRSGPQPASENPPGRDSPEEPRVGPSH